MPLSDDAVDMLPTVNKFMALVKDDPSILQDSRAALIKKVFEGLGAKIPAADGDVVEEPVEDDDEDPERMAPESDPLPAMPEGAPDDWEGAASHKEAAGEAKANGDHAGAVAAYTKALACQPSALTFANRADALLKLKRPTAAVADCDAALALNPDSAKALKIRGKALRYLGQWEGAHRTLAKANAIDFDPDLQDMFKLVEGKAKALAEKRTAARLEQQEAEKRERRERAAQARAAQQAAEDEAAAKSRAAPPMGGMGGMPGMGGMGGMPGMGGMGGMPGMGGMGGGMPPGMEGLMSDPDLVASLQNPKVMSFMQRAMSGDTSAMMEAMQDPEVGPVIMKLQAKMGGMGGMGGAPQDDDDDGDLPDLDEVPDLD